MTNPQPIYFNPKYPYNMTPNCMASNHKHCGKLIPGLVTKSRRIEKCQCRCHKEN